MEDAKALLNYFAKKYIESTGEKYIYNWGRDVKIFTSLLKEADFNKIKNLLDLYFSIKTKIYSIVFFKSQINELVQKLPKEEKPKQKMVNPDEWRFL